MFFTTAIAYFRDWAPSAALYYAADGDLVDLARYLNAGDLTGVTPYIASIHYRHPTLAALARDYGRIRWLTGGSTVVFPAQGEALLIVPRSASDDLAWIESVLPADSLVAALPGPDGAPAFHAYRVAAGPEVSPTHPLTANLANAVNLLGYDVLGEPRSGASADVAVWWRVLTAPGQGDYGPVARLADPWGSVWGESAPFHQITGGKIIRSSTGKSHNRARQAFLQAAASVARSNCAFGAFYRRLKARVGPAQAQVATAHKIARVAYHLLKYKVEYCQMSAQEYEQQFREREIRHLQRKAARLGFTLSPQPAGGAVS